MSDVEREIKLTVRVSLVERVELRKRAFKADLPVAVYLRTSALAGTPVAPKPPAMDELTDACKKLLHVCHAGVSNTSQLHGHATAAGAPLDRLCGPSGFLMEAQHQLRDLGLNVKTGDVDEVTASQILGSGLLAASDQLNILAESLNESQHPTHTTWHNVLSSLRAALEQIK